MEGYKLKDLKLKEFDFIQEMFDRAFKRVNTFEDFRTELVEGKEKRAGEELVQEITKKKKKPTKKETWVPQPSGPTESVTDKAIHKELGDRLTKTTQKKEIASQQDEIASLKRRVNKLEKINRSRTHGLKRLYKVGLSTRVESSSEEEILGEDASKQGRRINAIDEVFVVGQNKNVVEEVVDAAQVSTAATSDTITIEEITLAQALEALKTSKPKVKGIVFQEPSKSTTTTISLQQSQDNGKGIMIEEPIKPKKKDQIMLDEEAAKKLQAKFDEEERLAREKDKKEERASIALIEEWDDIQAKIDADHQLA
uniref:Uncharacterized protein n=1 Tax=Tanacetum cinerariifolium TaxID=118510 RepID=A0A6L2MCI8_TANCI|nr:hypothetical protein [Tanacetum cinerariifolium]